MSSIWKRLPRYGYGYGHGPSLRLRPPLRARTTAAATALVLTLSWTPAFIFVNDYVATVMRVRGASMYPLFNPDVHASLDPRTWVLVDRRGSARLEGPRGLRRGSVVVFRSPLDPERILVKRVVAVAGDEVCTAAPYPRAREIVPYGHVWVEGDNPDPHKTLDSNTFGPVLSTLVTGQVRAIVWPWRAAAWICPTDYPPSSHVSPAVQPVQPPQIYET